MTRVSMFGMYLVVTCLLVGLGASAQTTQVSGTITDAVTGEPLPFVNVAFVDSRVGTTTDFDGKYTLDTYYATDSLRASFVGYQPQTFRVKRDEVQVIDFKLAQKQVTIDVVEIKPQEVNPSEVILKRMIANKPVNDREKLSAYEYEAYNKVEFDLNNLSDEFTEKKIFKPFKFVFENIDTAGGKPYLPVFMTESLSNVYYRQSPKAYREHIKGTKVSGIQNESVSQFLGDMYQNVNIYDNFLIIFGKNFVSPISDNGKAYYNYYLQDSAWVGNNWCYHLAFSPKRPQELTFVGDMWLNDTTYAVRKIQAGFADEINLNFVRAFSVKQEYNEVEKEVWMLTRDELTADLNVTDKETIGLYGRRLATYKDFIINKSKPDEFYEGPERVKVLKEAGSDTDEYWEEKRHEKLSAQERKIYHMVDTMKTIPQFRTYVDILNLIFTGYYVSGDFEFGPYFTVYSFNPVEGHRFRLGGRTSNAWSTKVQLEGYAAYGLRDTEVKYGFGGKGFISKNPRIMAGAYFKSDMEQLGQSQNAFQQDNILSSVFRRNPATKLTKVNEYKMFIERDWFSGFSNLVQLRFRDLFPRGDLEYIQLSENLEPFEVNRISTAEIAINTRFAYREKYVSGEFERVSLGTRYPILELQTAFGIPNLLGSDYEYQKVVGRIKQRVPIGQFGYFKYSVEGGRMWGTLAYPLLIIHAGNETFYYDDEAYNMMNFFEFISDRYASLHFEHHLDGFLFNKVPLFRKLKWREVWTAKLLYGELDSKHQREMRFLPTMNALGSDPFVEMSAGIENILKFVRVDGLWRLTYRDNPNVPLFTVRLKFHLDF